jgi:peptide/nickel transport system ATP-binding protein
MSAMTDAPKFLVTDKPLLELRDVSVDYGSGEGAVHAVRNVNLVIHEGEAVGLAGESGSGKSTLAMAVTRLLRDPANISGGQVLYHQRTGDPVDLVQLDSTALRPLRWNEIAIVLQSAMNALNPVLNIQTQLTDVMRAHRPEMSKQERAERAGDLLETVGVSRDRLRAFPHELSGGMRQRAMIAMALALNPKLIVMDEPTTALDVVTQRQILEELSGLRERFGFAVLFITHDLSLLLEMADRIAIMYAGSLVEVAGGEAVYHQPAHPYTAGLLSSFPPLSGARRKLVGIPGSPPDLRELPPGCPFAPRCAAATDGCTEQRPQLTAPAAARPGDPERLVACFHDLISDSAAKAEVAQ